MPCACLPSRSPRFASHSRLPPVSAVRGARALSLSRLSHTPLVDRPLRLRLLPRCIYIAQHDTSSFTFAVAILQLQLLGPRDTGRPIGGAGRSCVLVSRPRHATSRCRFVAESTSCSRNRVDGWRQRRACRCGAARGARHHRRLQLLTLICERGLDRASAAHPLEWFGSLRLFAWLVAHAALLGVRLLVDDSAMCACPFFWWRGASAAASALLALLALLAAPAVGRANRCDVLGGRWRHIAGG